MKVELLSHTPQPEKLCAMAAKLCYSAGMPRKKDLTPDKAGPFLERIMESGHLSVLFAQAGAPCGYGPCPEGAMSCKLR